MIESVLVIAISVPGRLAFLDDGRVWPIVAFLDEDHETVADPADAVAFICGQQETGYIVEAFDDYDLCEDARLH